MSTNQSIRCLTLNPLQRNGKRKSWTSNQPSGHFRFAVEFGDKYPGGVMTIARQTLEGGLGGVEGQVSSEGSCAVASEWVVAD